MINNIKPQLLAAAGLLIIYIVNIFTPAEYNIDILYLSSIVLVFKQRSRTIICFCVGACVLIIINALLFDLKYNLSGSVWLNHIIAIFAILITSYIAIHYRMLNRSAVLKGEQHSKSLEEMIFITSHQVRKPVANILGLIEIINVDMAHLSMEDLKEHCQFLKISGMELDGLIKDLTAFIEKADRNNQQLAI